MRVCLLDGAIGISILQFVQCNCINETLTLIVEFVYSGSSSENNSLISCIFKPPLYDNLRGGMRLSLGDQLRRKFSSEWIMFEGGKPPWEQKSLWLFIAQCRSSLLKHVPLDPWQDLNGRP